MYCGQCGHKVNTDSNFCPECGAKVEETAKAKKQENTENQNAQNISDLDERLERLESIGINHPKLIYRSLTVWGYAIIAQLTVGIVFFFIILFFAILAG